MIDTTNLTPLEALRVIGSDLRVCHYGRMPDDVQEAYDKVFAALAQPTQAPAPEQWRKAVQEAYGWLWHVNNEPAAPVPLWSPEKAAYEARRNLRELLTSAERGEAINAVAGLLDNKMRTAQAPAQPAPQPSTACHWPDCPHGAECVHAQPSTAEAVERVMGLVQQLILARDDVNRCVGAPHDRRAALEQAGRALRSAVEALARGETK